MPRHLVITVHGIRTFGDWQHRLESLIPVSHRDQITFHHYKFGYFSFLKFVFPPARWFVTKRFKRYLRQEVANDDWSRIDLVGHSFGTHVIGWALRDLSPNTNSRRIHTVIFASSVLKSTFDWSEVFGKCLTRLANDCSVNDIPLIFSKLFSLFTGSAGREGFVGPTSSTFQNRYFKHGHSGYFRGPFKISQNAFMKRNWLPLLLGTEPIEPVSRPQRSKMDLFLDWFCDYADPLKLVFYLTPVLLFTTWIHGLYTTADTAKHLALTNEAKALTSLAQQKLKDADSAEALRLALSASAPDKPELPETHLTLYNAFLAYRDSAKLTLPGGSHIRDIFVDSSKHRVATTRVDLDTVRSRPHLLQIWAIDKTYPLLEHHLSAGLGKSAFSGDGRFFAFENRPCRSIRLLTIETGVFVDFTLQEGPQWIRDIAFSPDGHELRAITHTSFARSEKDAAKVLSWRIEEQSSPRQGTHVVLQDGILDLGDAVQFSPAGAYAWSPRNSEFWLWDVATGQRVGTVPRYGPPDVEEAPKPSVGRSATQYGRILAFDRNERYLVFSTKPNLPAIWDLRRRSVVAELGKHDDVVVAAAFSGDGRLLATASADGTVHVSATRTDQPPGEPTSKQKGTFGQHGFTTLSTFSAHHSAIKHLTITRDGRVLTTSLDGSLHIWDVATGVELSSRENFAGNQPSDQVVFSPAGRFALVASQVFTGIHGHELRMVDLDSGPATRIFPNAGPSGSQVTVAPTAHYALRVPLSQPATAELWDLRTGQLTGRLTGHAGPILASSFNNSGTYVATASADKTVRLWDVGSGRFANVFEGHTDSVLAVFFGRHNDRFVTASQDQTIRVWNTSKKTPIATIPFAYQSKVPTVAGTETVSQLLTLFPIRLSYDSHFLGFVELVDQVFTLVFWNIKTQQRLTKYVVSPFDKANWQPVFDFCSDANKILMVSTDKPRELWLLDLDRSDQRTIPTGHTGVILSVRFDEECKRIATASTDKHAHVLDAETARLIGKSPAHHASVLHAAFGPGGRRVVTASEDLKIRLWDFRRDEQHIELVLKHDSGVAMRADVSTDGKRLITVSADASGFRNRVVRVFPLYSRQELIDRSWAALTRRGWRSP